MDKIIFNIMIVALSIELSNCMLPAIRARKALHISAVPTSQLHSPINHQTIYIAANYSLSIVKQHQEVGNFLKVIDLQILQGHGACNHQESVNQDKYHDITTQTSIATAQNLLSHEDKQTSMNYDLSISADKSLSDDISLEDMSDEYMCTNCEPIALHNIADKISDVFMAISEIIAPCIHNFIVLPERGAVQPTPAEVVVWSCANIQNDNITNWYLSVFGLSENRGTISVVGYLGNCPRKIINFDSSMSQSSRDAFVKVFTTIASNSVGRALLYRLLLETRNNTKKITIQESDHAAYLRNEDVMKFPISEAPHCLPVLDKTMDGNHNLVSITKHIARKDSTVFHEMLHWFHQLHNASRKTTELEVNIGINEKPFDNVFMESHTPLYWVTPLNNRSVKKIKLEEMRTTLGYTVPIKLVVAKTAKTIQANKIYQSDDLSENLYRLCIGEPLRYGHNSLAVSVEHLPAIQQVITACAEAAKSGGYRVANAPVSLGEIEL